MLMTPSGWLDTLNVVLAILVSMMVSILVLAVLETHRAETAAGASATPRYAAQAGSEKTFRPSEGE